MKVAGPSVMNDGLISNALQFAAQGAPSMITLWDKTGGQIKGVAAMTTYPLYLITRNPDVKSITDFGPQDKIAVPSIKISTQAIMLQMAAAKAFGDKEYARLDVLTVWTGASGCVACLHEQHRRRQRALLFFAILRAGDEAAGRAPAHDQLRDTWRPCHGALLTASAKFREANPKTYKAFLDALSEAIDAINNDKRAAARSSISTLPRTPRAPSMISSPSSATRITPSR